MQQRGDLFRDSRASRIPRLASLIMLVLLLASPVVRGQQASELTVWQDVRAEAKACQCCRPFEEFVAAFPDSQFSRMAAVQVAKCPYTPPPPDPELLLWQAALAGNTCDAYRKYLADHPNGAHAAAARGKVQAICVPDPPPTPPTPQTPSPQPQPPSPTMPEPGSSIEPAPVPPPRGAMPSPEAFVTEYYAALNRADARTAVAMWSNSTSPKKRRQISEDVANNEWFKAENVVVIEQDADGARVRVDVSGKNKGRRESAGRWSLDLYLRREGDEWRLDNLKPSAR